jgi:hypothetical protein
MYPTERVSSELRVASDKGAIAGWIFMAIWLGFLGIFTWVFIRDGGFRQFEPALERAVLMLFWVFGVAASAYIFSMPIVTLAVTGDDFIARERWLRSTRVSRFPIGPESRPAIRRTKDSEGDDLFLAEVTTPDGRRISLGGRSDLDSARAWLSAMDLIIDGR